MRCPECGAKIKNDVLFCPQCGATPRPEQRQERSTGVRGGCRRFVPVMWGALALFLAMGFLGVAAWRGLVEGRKQWQSNAEATASAEYQRCEQYLAEEKWALAAAACRQANSLQPGYPGAREGYATAVVALTPEPTPTVTVVTRTADEIFADAEALFGREDWRGTLGMLNELWQSDPGYLPDEVQDMRHTALVALGQEALQEGRLEQAIYYLDQAAEIEPLDAELDQERRLAARYLSALNYCGVDWEVCTARLSGLYTEYPSYRDVFVRLVGAYTDWAQVMADIGEWCPAEVHYGEALNLQPDASLEAKRTEASERCLLATPTPIPGQITGTVTVTVEGFNVGRLAYTAYNQQLGVYDLYTLSAYDGRLDRLTSSAAQPSWRRDGGMLAYRGVSGIQALSPAGGGPLTLVADPSAFWPSWSPDGGRVAYARQEADGWRIYTVPIDGSAPQQPLGLGKYPVWGPQGALAFNGCLVDGVVHGICVINPDDPGAGPVPLTADPNDIPVSWSPGGDNLAYMSNHGGDWDIFLVNTSGGVVLLTADDANPASDGLPAWSPDGSAIAFVSNREGTWELYLMAPDGSNVRQLLGLGEQHPNWLLERLSWAP
jgi:tetratricopeptide (TPR) repeat protein